MWAKGPMPGYSPKSIFLKFYPGAVCCKKSKWGITGYVVYLSDDAETGVCGANTSKAAWELALDRKEIGYDVITKEWYQSGTTQRFQENEEEE